MSNVHPSASADWTETGMDFYVMFYSVNELEET